MHNYTAITFTFMMRCNDADEIYVCVHQFRKNSFTSTIRVQLCEKIKWTRNYIHIEAICAKVFDGRSVVQNAQNPDALCANDELNSSSKHRTIAGRRETKTSGIIRRPFTGNLAPFHTSARVCPRKPQLRAFGPQSDYHRRSGDELYPTSVRVFLPEWPCIMLKCDIYSAYGGGGAGNPA